MLPPESLIDLQSWMAQVLRMPLRARDEKKFPVYEGALLQEAKKRIKPSPSLSPEQRLGLYNSQVWYRFFNLVQKDFPSLVRLFGAHDFNSTLAEPYLLSHWPIHASISILGSSLPAHLETHYQEEDARLVIPLAKLDAAYHRLADATPYPALKQDKLEASIRLQPTLELFEMEADLISFRTELLKQPIEAWVDLDFPPIAWSKPKHYLLCHKNNTFHSEELPLPAFRLLRAFQQGATVSIALASLSQPEAKAAAPHLFSWFQRWCSHGWLY